MRRDIEVLLIDVTRNHKKTTTGTGKVDGRLQPCSTMTREDGLWRWSAVSVRLVETFVQPETKTKAACTFGASIICVDLVVRLFPGHKNFKIEDSNAFLSTGLSLSFGVMVRS